MTEISTAAGGAESPAAEEGSGHNAPQTRQEVHVVSGEGNNALPATTGDHKAHQNQGDDGACLSSTPIGDAGIAPNRTAPASPSAPNPDSAHSVPGPSADAVPTSENLPSSLGTTAVSSPARLQGNNAGTGAQTTSPGTMFLLVALAKFAAFTDVFLSGLIVPLVPAILEYQAKVPHEQVQVWTSVFIAAYGGAFAVVSPLMPFLTRQGPLIWVILVAGLACAGAAFALIQLSSTLYPLILARALQGLSAAATTGTCSGMLATAAGANGRANTLSWITPALLQSTALAAAPVTAGYLYENVSTDAVFYLAYALVASNVLFSLVAAKITPYGQTSVNSQGSVVATTSVSGGYGTIATEVDQPQASPSGAEHRQRTTSQSRSPMSASPARSARSSSVSTILPEPSSWSPRLLVATYGYLVLGVTATALQTVLPLFVQRHFHWSVARTGFMFVPLSVPAVLVGPLAGLLAARVPILTRFLAAIGFGAAIPALISLGSFGRLAPSTVDIERAFFSSLAGLSLATGLSGDPLIKEITSIVGPSAINDPLSAAAQATSIPNVANAWGSLIGPLLAGAIRWIWGWETLTRALAYVSGFTGVVVLLFLQGWIGSPHSETGRRRGERSNDEEAAPLLANAHPDGGSYRPREQVGSHRSKKGTSGAPSQDANKASPHARKKSGHRRHFSVDNFSVATTTGPGSVDSATSQVRFQAALETLQESTTKRPPTGDSSRATAERRYTMREAPHAPTTDPLLAVGSRYVIDEERSIVPEGETPKRHVVVFAEGTAPPELLERHRHHIVAINGLDGTAQMVSSSTTDNHAVSVTEEAGDDQPEFSEATSRRYVVVVVEEGDDEASP